MKGRKSNPQCRGSAQDRIHRLRYSRAAVERRSLKVVDCTSNVPQRIYNKQNGCSSRIGPCRSNYATGPEHLKPGPYEIQGPQRARVSVSFFHFSPFFNVESVISAEWDRIASWHGHALSPAFS